MIKISTRTLNPAWTLLADWFVIVQLADWFVIVQVEIRGHNNKGSDARRYPHEAMIVRIEQMFQFKSLRWVYNMSFFYYINNILLLQVYKDKCISSISSSHGTLLTAVKYNIIHKEHWILSISISHRMLLSPIIIVTSKTAKTIHFPN